MTEAEWLTCTDPTAMLKFLPGKASERKLRLFAVACCRRMWRLLPDDACRKAVDSAEEFAEGLVGVQLLRRGEDAAAYYQDNPDEMTQDGVDYLAAGAVFQLCQDSVRPEDVACAAHDTVLRFKMIADSKTGSIQAPDSSEPLVQCRLVHCILGNPFHRPTALSAAVLAWNDGTVRRLAEGIYEERAFDRLPILHDALLDAGCDDEDILAHCRNEGPHVRGCWVIDLLLGKE